MLSVNVLRRVRPCIVSLSVGHTHNTIARHRAAFTGAVREKQPPAHVGRSLLSLTHKSPCPSISCFSTVTHSDDSNLIYTGSLARAVRGIKLFSYSSSGFSLFLMPHIILKTGLGVQGFACQAAFFGVIGFFTFLTPGLLHLLTKGYVVRLYHNPDRDTYTAVTYSLFLTEKKTVFHQRQVRIPAVSKMFTTFYADNVGLLIDPDLFPVPHDYNHLMGYDKPFVFHTDSMSRPDKS